MHEFFGYGVVKNKQHHHKFKVKTKIKLQFGFSMARADQPKLPAKVFSSFSIWIAIFHPRFSNKSAPSEKSWPVFLFVCLFPPPKPKIHLRISRCRLALFHAAGCTHRDNLIICTDSTSNCESLSYGAIAVKQQQQQQQAAAAAAATTPAMGNGNCNNNTSSSCCCMDLQLRSLKSKRSLGQFFLT